MCVGCRSGISDNVEESGFVNTKSQVSQPTPCPRSSGGVVRAWEVRPRWGRLGVWLALWLGGSSGGRQRHPSTPPRAWRGEPRRGHSQTLRPDQRPDRAGSPADAGVLLPTRGDSRGGQGRSPPWNPPRMTRLAVRPRPPGARTIARAHPRVHTRDARTECPTPSSEKSAYPKNFLLHCIAC